MSYDVLSPIDGNRIQEVELMTLEALEKSIDKARAVQPSWAKQKPSGRAEILHRIGETILKRRDEIAEVESRNTGKTLVDTRREVARGAETFKYYASWADKVVGETIPLGEDMFAYTLPESRGLIAAIIPWNVPFFFSAKKIAPALAFGNACILKPALETPLSAMILNEILQEEGVPDGLVTLAIGGVDIGQALVASDRIDGIVFTGSDETGKHIAKSAASNVTPVTLELGGKSPQIVFADADLDLALDAVVLGVFATAGQMCIAGSRLLLEAAIYDEFMDALSKRVTSLNVGSPFDDRTDLGPQITAVQRDKTMRFIETGTQEGELVAQASLPADKSLEGGFYVPPTLFAGQPISGSLFQNEIFGPVLVAEKFASEAEAVQLANATPYGLAAGVWTRDIDRANRMVRAIRAGTVWVNTYRVLSEQVPFGGVGLSGYGAENGSEAQRIYTRLKSVWTSMSGDLPRGYSK